MNVQLVRCKMKPSSVKLLAATLTMALLAGCLNESSDENNADARVGETSEMHNVARRATGIPLGTVANLYADELRSKGVAVSSIACYSKSDSAPTVSDAIFTPEGQALYVFRISAQQSEIAKQIGFETEFDMSGYLERPCKEPTLPGVVTS